MGISVKSRVHRTLSGLERFRRCERWDQLPQLEGIDSPLKGTEMLLGVYENLPGRADQLLLFTDLAVHLWEGSGWRSLKYADIAATEWPTGIPYVLLVKSYMCPGTLSLTIAQPVPFRRTC